MTPEQQFQKHQADGCLFLFTTGSYANDTYGVQGVYGGWTRALDVLKHKVEKDWNKSARIEVWKNETRIGVWTSSEAGKFVPVWIPEEA